jgi:regulator of protease activity HflC (stomatin/prohibitin superfamily)
VVVFRLGRLLPELRGPGLFLVIPLLDRIVRVDLLKETPAEAVGAHRFVGEKVVVRDANTVLVPPAAPWPARSVDGSPLVAGEHLLIERVEDDLQLVVGSVPSPTGEEPS